MGLLPNSTSGLGRESVRGRKRVPNPPTRINAFIVRALTRPRGRGQRSIADEKPYSNSTQLFSPSHRSLCLLALYSFLLYSPNYLYIDPMLSLLQLLMTRSSSNQVVILISSLVWFWLLLAAKELADSSAKVSQLVHGSNGQRAEGCGFSKEDDCADPAIWWCSISE